MVNNTNKYMFSNGCCVTRLGIDFIYIDCATAYVAKNNVK